MYERFSRAFDKCQNNFSTDIRIRKFTKTSGSVYDDDITLTSGVDTWVKGTIQSLDKSEGSTDSVLVEQGKLIYNDTKIFFHGSVILTGSTDMFKLQIGSPTGDQFALIPIGGINKQVEGVAIYKIGYVRMLTNGSLIGE